MTRIIRAELVRLVRPRTLLLGALAACPLEVVIDPTRFRAADLPVVWGDSSKLGAMTGWQPEIPLRQTLADALDYARDVVARENVAKA